MDNVTQIHNLNELKRNLKYGDLVYFTTKNEVLEYKVFDTHLNCPNCPRSYPYLLNDYIFKCLCLNEEQKNNLAERCYGYKNDGGLWPYSKHYDFEGLTKLVREIYKMLGETEEIFKPILNRFEILDL